MSIDFFCDRIQVLLNGTWIAGAHPESIILLERIILFLMSSIIWDGRLLLLRRLWHWRCLSFDYLPCRDQCDAPADNHRSGLTDSRAWASAVLALMAPPMGYVIDQTGSLSIFILDGISQMCDSRHESHGTRIIIKRYLAQIHAPLSCSWCASVALRIGPRLRPYVNNSSCFESKHMKLLPKDSDFMSKWRIIRRITIRNRRLSQIDIV